jgi:hypothetical protein
MTASLFSQQQQLTSSGGVEWREQKSVSERGGLVKKGLNKNGKKG